MVVALGSRQWDREFSGPCDVFDLIPARPLMEFSQFGRSCVVQMDLNFRTCQANMLFGMASQFCRLGVTCSMDTGVHTREKSFWHNSQRNWFTRGRANKKDCAICFNLTPIVNDGGTSLLVVSVISSVD